MISQTIFQSRKEKEVFLKKIIHSLTITETEKEIYDISIEILDDTDFGIFFHRITSQIPENSGEKIAISSLSSTIL